MNRRWGLIMNLKSKHAPLVRPPKGHRAVGTQLTAAVKLGLALAELPPDALDPFLAMTADADIAVAQQMAALVSGLGIQISSPEQRNALSLKVDQRALKLASSVIRGLLRAAQAEEATGAKGAVLQSVLGKLSALRSEFSRSLGQSEEIVGDGKRVLEAWQYEAQTAITTSLLQALSDKSTPLDARRQLLVDAAEMLDAIEEVLLEAQAAQKKAAADQGLLNGQVEEAQRELQLLQTMRDLRDHKPVDETLLSDVAAFYAQYTATMAARSAEAAQTEARRQGR